MNIVDLDKLCELFWDGNFMEIHKDDIPSIPSAFEGMTNGEVIQVLFPNIETREFAITIHATAKVECDGIKGGISYDFWKEWWNAPYKAESEDKAE